MKYEELGEEVDDIEEEWKKYKDAFVGYAEELCGRSTGMGGTARKQIKNGVQPKSHQQHARRRTHERLLERSRSTKVSLSNDIAFIWTDENSDQESCGQGQE